MGGLSFFDFRRQHQTSASSWCTPLAGRIAHAELERVALKHKGSAAAVRSETGAVRGTSP